jgi:hypothetical protein
MSALLLLLGGATPTWEISLACTLHASGPAEVVLQLDAPGCLEAPLGALTLGPDDQGAHVLVDDDDPGLPALRRCAAQLDHLTLWVLPAGGSGCGHRLLLHEALPDDAGVHVWLPAPLRLETAGDIVGVHGVVQVSPQ